MMKSFFSSIAREALARENIPEGELRLTEHQQSSAATSDTVEQFIIYPTLLSDDLNIEPDMVEWNYLEVMMRKMEQMEVAVWNRDVEMEAPHKELQAMKKKEEDKGYVQTWENNTTPKMHAPIVSESNAGAGEVNGSDTEILANPARGNYSQKGYTTDVCRQEQGCS